MDRRGFMASIAATAAMTLASQARAAGGTLRGVTDTEIRIGQTNPYSGPASVYAAWYGKVHLAYCDYVNSKGGINGRKIKLISYDDGYQPPRTIEQVRRLIERDNVAAIFMIFGTAGNESVKTYVNSKKVPMLFAGTSAEGFADPAKFPYSMPFSASAGIEATIYGKYIRENLAGKKICILYQQDDIGVSVRNGLRRGLGEEASKLIVNEQAYQVSDTTVDSQVLAMRASGAEIFYNSATLKHAVQAMKKASEIGWNPTTFILNTTTPMAKLLAESGSRMADTVMATAYFKSPVDPKWDKDPAMVEWKAFMAKFYPDGDATEPSCVLSTAFLQAMLYVLQACGNDLTTENIMRVATSMKDVEIPLLLPGIKLNTSATDYLPIEELQLIRYDSGNWVDVGGIVSSK